MSSRGPHTNRWGGVTEVVALCSLSGAQLKKKMKELCAMEEGDGKSIDYNFSVAVYTCVSSRLLQVNVHRPSTDTYYGFDNFEYIFACVHCRWVLSITPAQSWSSCRPGRRWWSLDAPEVVLDAEH